MNENSAKTERSGMSRWLKIFLISLGVFFICLGFVGIFIPVLPTTPFVLLSAALFARSSERFYRWLITNRFFGQYLKDYREGRGVPRGIGDLSNHKGRAGDLSAAYQAQR